MKNRTIMEKNLSIDAMMFVLSVTLTDRVSRRVPQRQTLKKFKLCGFFKIYEFLEVIRFLFIDYAQGRSASNAWN